MRTLSLSRPGVLQRTPAAKFTVRTYFGGNQHTALGEWVVRVNQSLQPYCTQSDLVVFITVQIVGPDLRWLCPPSIDDLPTEYSEVVLQPAR